jgi:hypothetical protein
MMGSRNRGIVLAAVLMTAAGTAVADPSSADRENARTYMADGRAKRTAGDLKSALRAFQAADAIMNVPTTAIEVAKTESMLGMLIEAHEKALEAAKSAPKPGEPPPFADARVAAQQLADEIEPRIPSIRLSMPSTDGVAVTLDDVTLPAAAIGMPRKLDPGTHVIVAKLGTNQRRVTVQVQERETKDVPIDWSEAATQPTTNTTTTTTSTSTPTTTTTTSTSTPLPDRRTGPPWVVIGGVTLGVGAVGIVVGAITGAMSLSQTSTLKAQCSNNVCPPSQGDALNSARALAVVSDVGVIAGAALAALGVTFLVVGATSHRSSTVGVRVGPSSIVLGGTF